MKYLLTCLALGLAFAAGAQTGLVEFPYNPDADNDDVIGVNDLLELLSLYGSEFAEESLYLNDSNTTAIYHIQGSWFYGMCQAKCRELPSGNWRMIDFETWAEFHLEIEQMTISGVNRAWLREMPIAAPANSTNNFPIVFGDYSDKGRLSFGNNSDELTCVCETQERPKVEYSYCRDSDEGGDPTPFAICAQEKAQDGWYPLGGMSSFPFNGVDYNSQAFWRWAE